MERTGTSATVLSVSGHRDAYLVLQVQPTAVAEVVEAAYRALALLHHPDLSSQPSTAGFMAELNWAYATLRDPERRAAYDRTRVPIPIAASRGSLLERMQGAAAAEQAPDSPGRAVIDFGRYAGMTLGQLLRTDPAYLEWLRRHSSGARYRHQIDELLAGAATRRAHSG